MLNIVIAELIEGNYVLYQGDLSTKMLEKLRIRVKPAAHRPCCIRSRLQLASFCTNSRGAGCSGGELPQDCGLALE
ncbi:MAG TPA: hypothetical protein DEO91_10040 [Pseudomonas sp.]|uniref:hypothetical protein n=1 Tax=Pseudomonas sp. Marseille-Q0931 TaxID=2697507 RepID=UPI000EBFE20B|nr:hypothetical protein [Pseudomonas sp.]